MASTTFSSGTVVTSTWLNEVDAGIFDSIYVLQGSTPTGYASLAAAVTGISTTRCTIVVRGDTSLTANTTIPSTATLHVCNGARITTTGYTLTVNGKFHCEPVQCFTGSGTVAFGRGAVKEVYPQWWGALGDGSTDDTSAIQTAIGVVSATTDQERSLYFLPGDYRVTTLDFTQMRQCMIVCSGAVFITGTSNATSYIVKIDASEPDPCNGLQMVGTMAIQATGTGYVAGFYARWMNNCVINMSVSGAYSTAAADLDACFDNDFQWLYCANTTAAKHHIKCGSNNVNVNRFRVRVAGSGSGNTQIGMELNGSGNSVFGDISNCGEGLKLTAARGSHLNSLYFEGCLTPVTASGVNRGNTFLGGYLEVLDGSTGMNFSGGTMQGINLIGVYFAGATGTTTGINWGTASYGANLIGCDMSAIDTEFTGTLLGSTGGVNAQLHGGTRHYHNGVVKTLAGSAATAVLQTVAGAGTVAIDASAGDEQILTVSTGSAFTIGAPTNLTQYQNLTIVIKNTSGGALGAITWNAVYKMASWTSPATGNSRSISFRYDGANWVERFRTPADVPN